MKTEKPILIGICGLKGSGKSEMAGRLATALSARRIRFAGPLKNMLRVLHLSEEEIEGALKEAPCDKLCGQTPRHAMLTLGTEWGRELIGSDIWLNAWRTSALGWLGEGQNVIAEDLRFPNEYDALVKAGGIVVRVARPGIPIGEHESEQHAASFGAHIEFWNQGSLDDLARWVDEEFPVRLEEVLETRRLAGDQ